MDTLGKRIKSIREKTGLNQLDLARHLGLESAMAISKYEADQREPDISKLIKLSDLGGVDLNWLLTGVTSEARYQSHPDRACESPVATPYDDEDVAAIVAWLRTNPKDKKLILKLIEGRKITKEALEGFGVGDLLNEEGAG
jgi:transcriptional regulator with XRE-family HTH domain